MKNINKQYNAGLDRARMYAIRAVKRNDLKAMDNSFKEIVEMCIQLKSLEKALEIKKELFKYL